ncbi:phage portal protein [Paenibacillus ehimensis]|uniref:phage portal protein n=1 Tax=Paenibacillus ehimensis TaxID=79264 RepID=UPI0004726FFB|nr:phage portal protein [Paenibacillus ehimensis]
MKDIGIIRMMKNMLGGGSREDEIQAFMLGDDIVRIPAGSVSSTTALKYSAVFSCVRVLGETFASVPFNLYRKREDGDRDIANDLAIHDILHHAPNDEMSPFNWKIAMMMALNLGGNGVSERLVNRRGELVGLYPYQWQQVNICRDPTTKKLQYKISSTSREEARTLERAQVFHVPGMSLDGIVGLSPIQFASQAIRLGLSYEKFGVRLYENGAFPSGAFSFEGVLGKEAFDRLKKDLAKNYQGAKNAGIPMLLEGGGKFVPFQISPADAQLIESKLFQIRDIARLYRVPLHLIGDLERSTNNNIEHQSLEFVMYTMLPWFKLWEENINAQLLTREERRAGYFVEANMMGLLRGDAKSRAEAYSIGRLNGWLSINDIRRLENLNRVEGGDEYIQPLNYINIKLADQYHLNKTASGQQQGQMQAMAEEIYKMITERGAA